MKKRFKPDIVVFSSLFLIFIYTLLLFPGCNQDNNNIKQAVKAQIILYPESTLQDIYKSFFQDEFGPGHLIDNVSFAREYFDLELEDMISRGRREAEPCGAGKNFLRVPMDLVKDGIIPEEVYFESFMESSADFKIPDLTTWKKKWGQIETEIEKMNLPIKNFENDKAALEGMLQSGETVVHHSGAYSMKYDPHYRIFGIKQWRDLQRSFLNQ